MKVSKAPVALQTHGTANRRSPEHQTNEEWLASYDGASTVPKPEALSRYPSDPDDRIYLFRYLDHRTTSQGHVALEFETLDSRLTAVKFFNVSLRSPWGTNYPAGKGGQFIPPKLGKFRRFWLQAVGKAPPRWCRVHKSMRSKLRGLVFEGKIERAVDSKGKPYFRITEIWPKRLGT